MILQKFHALSDPTRFAIVQMISEKSMTVGDLQKPFQISGPAISRHLKILEQAELIEREINAQSRIIHINQKGFQPIKSWVGDMESFWNNKLDNLEKFLEQRDIKHD